MKTKILRSILTALTMLGSTFSYAYDAEIAGIYYNFKGADAEVTYMTDENEFKSNSTAYSGSLRIPSSVVYNGNTYYVTSIGYGAFSYCSELTSVTIPDLVETIGEGAFYGCSSMNSINIPNSVTSIGVQAFQDCASLTSITIPNSVTSIGNYAFSGCTSLTSFIIPESVTKIGGRTFLHCSSLTSITIPNSVTSIEEFAFQDCPSLTSLTIPNSVTSIGRYAFSKCPSLTTVALPESITTIEERLFWECSRLTSITIPNPVTSIGNYAFSGCYGMTSVTIPESVTTIGNSAFYDCSKLTSIIIPSSVTSIGTDAFKNCSRLKKVVNLSSQYMSRRSEDNGFVAYYADAVYNGKSAEDIGEWRFLTNTDGNNILWDYIGTANSIELPEDFNGKSYKIGNYVFYNLDDLITVTIPNHVTSIGNYAFAECSGLTSVTISNSVTSIGIAAFMYCSNLRDIYCLNTTPPTCGGGVFEGVKTANTRLHVPAGTKEDYAFTNGWSVFYNIIEDAGGEVAPELVCDLNKDGVVDINDIIFILAHETYSGTAEELAILIENSNPTPVTPAEIEALYGDAEYYTLDGVKVSDPTTPGIYIVKKDGETKMIVVKK